MAQEGESLAKDADAVASVPRTARTSRQGENQSWATQVMSTTAVGTVQQPIWLLINRVH